MKNGWITKTIEELCVLRPPKAEVRNRLKPQVKVSFLPMDELGIDTKYPSPTTSRSFDEVYGSYTYFADGDVLLAKITPCFQNGKLGIARDLVNGIGFGSSEFFVLRPSADLDREYLYYFLSREDFRQEGVLRMGGAVGQQRVPPEFVLGQRLMLPPLSERRRIVGILDEAFEGLATAKANAEQNLQNARALFESGLNSAISGELTHGWRGSNPNTENASSQLQKSLAERRRHWNGSGKYKYKEPDSPITTKPVVIPKSWTLASPEQIATHIVDCPHSTPKWTESGLVCLRTTNFKPGFSIWSPFNSSQTKLTANGSFDWNPNPVTFSTAVREVSWELRASFRLG